MIVHYAHPHEHQRGAIVLLTVILIGAMVVTIGVTAAFVGQTQVIVGGQMDARTRVLLLASTCLDEAAYRLKRDAAYVGGSVPVGNDSCTVVVAGSGATRTLTATASSGDFTRAVEVTATRRQNAAANATGWSLGAWTEVDL